jgi:adenylate cyclase
MILMTANVASSAHRTHRLACVMFADLVGYSALVEEDEAGTLAAVDGIRETIIAPQIGRHGGRLIRTTGDGFFAEFPAATDGVACGIEIQRAMTSHDERPGFALRIGLNLGEVTDDGKEIYGHDVNVAARLETMCRPEGICVSNAVYQAVAGKIDERFEDGGPQVLRNIKRPVHVWYWDAGRPSFAVGGLLAGKLALPSRPSIAVLPFNNMSDDPSQDYFADGLVEDIITELSKVRWFFVTARNSSFVYKGRSVDIRDVSRELGVRYVLEGSVRKYGNQIRVTAQLLDGTNGNHIWAEAMTDSLEHVFELQDSIAHSVVGAIEPKMRSAEIERARRKPTANLDAYDLYLRALPHMVSGTAGDMQAALALFERAVALDPNYALAQAAVAFCRERQLLIGAMKPSPELYAETCALARKAVALDPGDPEVLSMSAIVIGLLGKDYVSALEWAETSTRLNPNSAAGWARNAFIRCWVSEFAAAIEYFLRAMRLSPTDPMRYAYQTGLGSAYMFTGEYATALQWLQRTLSLNRHFAPAYRYLAVTQVRMGKLEDARQTVRELLAIDPLSSISRSEFYTGFRDAEPRQLYVESLRLAGLPE